jgi:hypothetical protein
MSIMKIKTTDPMLNFLNIKQKAGDFKHIMSPFGETYTINNNTSEVTFIEAQNNQAYVDYSFSYTVKDQINTTQYTSYNAVDFFNTPQMLGEIQLKSIYDLTPSQMTQIQENSKNGVFINPTDIISLLTQNTTTEVISLVDTLDKAEIYETKNHFPFHVDFRFTNTKNSFYKLLLENDAYELMIESLNAVEFVPETFSTNMGSIPIMTTDLMSVINSITPNVDDWKIFYAPLNEYDWTEQGYDAIDLAQLETKIRQHIKDNAPTFSSIVSGGRTATYEPICYKIEKFIPNEQTPIQVFYVPASDGNRDFLDTQINFGATYRYKISAIGISFGLAYEYNINASNSLTTMIVNSVPRAKFFQINLLDENISIDGIAPTRPEVSFLNRSNQEKKIRFYFEPSIFDTREDFIQLQESDLNTQISAKKDNEDKTIFRLGQDNLIYQIYKLNQKPKSYSDFADALHTEIIGADRSSSEVYEMFLTPNRKFYFLFRTKNGFDLFSNPTSIYEVELVQDSDQTRIVSKTIEFSTETKARTKKFGRFLRIYPAFEQIVLREYGSILESIPLKSNIGDGPVIKFNNKKYFVGTADNPIWGKKMKFRIRSKNTGKMVDINVDFALEKIETEEDF